MIKYEKKPKSCHFCGGDVIFTSNAEVYGREYGNGKCYLCKKCGAYTGIHTGTEIAVGILSNKEMRNLKIECHDIFDKLWNSSKQRNELYRKLADEMKIERRHCHFGHFDIEELKKSIKNFKELGMSFKIASNLKDSFNPYPKPQKKEKARQKRTDKTEE